MGSKSVCDQICRMLNGSGKGITPEYLSAMGMFVIEDSGFDGIRDGWVVKTQDGTRCLITKTDTVYTCNLKGDK